MGCGCGGAKPARRPVTSMGNPNSKGVLKAVAVANTKPTQVDVPQISEERRKVEKLRRDAILRALGRP